MLRSVTESPLTPRDISEKLSNAESRREELKKLKSEQLEARRAKLARQDKEDKETQAIIDKQGQKAREVDTEKNTTSQSSVIRPFRALNEGAGEEDNKSPTLQKAGPQGKSESEDDSEDPGVPRQENTSDYRQTGPSSQGCRNQKEYARPKLKNKTLQSTK